jgi:hypothetical protein
MTRHLRLTLLVFSLGLLPPALARAQEEEEQGAAAAEPGSAEDEEEQAAKHFAKGRKLYGEGNYKQAIEELLKAYELRPAPPILLNIARTYEKLGDKKNALKFYKEFLLKARNVDPNRPQVEAVVKELEKQVGGKTGAVTSAEGTDTPTATATDQGSASMPAGKQQLIHTPVDTVKVDQPITLVAELPPGVTADRLVVHFRKGGEVSFRELALQPQGDAYVVQIPARFVTSTSLQYYLEALRGTGRGAAVAQAGTKLTPHIVVIEGGIPIGVTPVNQEIRSPYRTWAWVSSAGTAAFVGLAVVGMVLAKDRAGAMETVARSDKNCDASCQKGARLPSERFNTRAQDWESEGQTFASMGYAFLAIGIVAAGVTTYLWVEDRLYLKEERARRRSFNARFTGAPWATAQGGGFVGRIDF